MRVRWAADAAEDLARICDYIAETRTDSALRMAQTIIEEVASLSMFPKRGRRGRVEGTRELVLAARKSIFCESFTVRSNGLRVSSRSRS